MKRIEEIHGIYLPIGQMLLINRILEFSPEHIVCESDLHNHWVFDVHFPGDPIFPGSLMIEGAGQTVAIWAWENGMRGAPRLVKTSAEFKSPIRPEDGAISYHARLKQRRMLTFGEVDVRAGDRIAAVVQVSLIVLAE